MFSLGCGGGGSNEDPESNPPEEPPEDPPEEPEPPGEIIPEPPPFG